ncbi:DUF2279 domain-containing protein [Gangjinia marincola]|uniref:DUF2279 domain-containing protein n=1 Tax=Gangjinia marincola TaxID=578463 RepID=A0ABN1MES2_9FLAO
MYRITALLFFFLFALSAENYGQAEKERSFFEPSDTLHKPRRNAVVLTEAAIGGLTLAGLYQLWYKDYEQSSFRFINDNDEWLQLDKVGHVYSSYHLGRVGADLLAWSGVKKRDQLLYGATLGLGFLTAVEVFDGFSAEWGASTGDLLANAAGTGFYIGQELLWQDQRMVLKYSFHQTQFSAQNPEKLGNGLAEEFLKDYNGQTYWISANVNAFLGDTLLPNWLNLAVGYGGEGMLTGIPLADDPTSRYRQYYLSLDIDFRRIKTTSGFLRSVFSVINTLKVPAPTLIYSTEKNLQFSLLYF